MGSYTYWTDTCNRIFLVKNKENVDILKLWLETCEMYHLVNDSTSVIPNCPGFQEHRHDQAIFSLLRKKKGFKTVVDLMEYDHKTLSINKCGLKY